MYVLYVFSLAIALSVLLRYTARVYEEGRGSVGTLVHWSGARGGKIKGP